MWDYHAISSPEDFQIVENAPEFMQNWYEGQLSNPSIAIFVAEYDKNIIGYICGMIIPNPPTLQEPQIGYISEISVLEKFQRRGVGKKLTEAIHKWFMENSTYLVEVNVFYKNQMAKNFWKKLGYKDFLERYRVRLK